jgi:hypothetical protein
LATAFAYFRPDEAMIQPLLSFLPVVLLGFFFLLCLWPLQHPTLSNLLIKSILATGVGLGISSCLVFVSLVLLDSLRTEIFLIEMLLLVVLAGGALRRIKARKDGARDERAAISARVSIIQKALAAGFCIALAASIFLFTVRAVEKPHGSYDAWSIWNLCARYLFRADGQWRDAFSELLFHPDYPLLIPASVARGWLWIGNETAAVPIFLALFFTLGTVGLVVCSLSILRSKSQGLLAGLVLLGTPFFIHHGASQTADVPLGFFILSSFVLLALNYAWSDGYPPLVILAGMTAGLCAWTKNEGLLVFLSILLSSFAIALQSKGWRSSLKQVGFFLLGSLPLLVTIIYFKTQMAPPNDLLGAQSIHIFLERLTQLSRYLVVLKYFLTEVWQFGDWPVSFPVVLAFYILLMGGSINHERDPHVGTALLALSLIVIGWVLVYVFSARDDLVFFLNTSLKRLFLQLWPSFVFVFFLIVRTPERALMIKETVKLPTDGNEVQSWTGAQDSPT